MSEAMRNFLGFLGLCRRAGKTVCGTPLVCLSLAGKAKPPLVLYAAGASPSTKKKITTKCAYYGICVWELAVSPVALAAAMGKGSSLAAVAITDSGFAAAMKTKLAAMQPGK